MRIATYIHDGRRQVGIVSPDGRRVTPCDTGADAAARGALALIERLAGGGGPPEPAGDALALDAVRLEAPLPRPRRNYHAHARELSATVFAGGDAAADAWPIVFTKVPECVVGPGAEIRLPLAVSTQIDYEAELAVVIGRGGRDIPRADAMAHVFGCTIVNDVTARDVQMRHRQWDLGKSLDTFCPMGPWIVTADELDGTDTRVRCHVNGEPRQDARTSDLIFDIPTLVETCSRGITLHPGDMIATGTPAGVGMAFDPPRYLRPGDTVRIEIDGIGVLENRCVADAA